MPVGFDDCQLNRPCRRAGLCGRLEPHAGKPARAVLRGGTGSDAGFLLDCYECTESLLNSKTVSYTHLDVYKRQGLDMADAAKLNTDIAVLVNGVVTFEGIIWDCTLTSGRELRLSCYDRLIYLTGSRDSAYFPAGNTTQSVISHICAKWDMPLTCLLYTSRCV